MKIAPVLLLLLAACSGGGEDEQGKAAGGNVAAPAPAEGSITSLTGLYEGRAGERTNQLCMLPGEGDATRFGLVVWGNNLHSCSGAGAASREGDTLRLSMTGDEVCTIEATLSGRTVTFPRGIPEGCAYYCGAQASMAGVSFTQTGTSAEDARKATDLVGEPLCIGG